jgi:hypothetical protein
MKFILPAGLHFKIKGFVSFFLSNHKAEKGYMTCPRQLAEQDKGKKIFRLQT